MSKKSILKVIPKNLDRDSTVFFQSVKDAIEQLQKNQATGGSGTDGVTKRQLTIVTEQINKDLEGVIDGKLNTALTVGKLLDALQGSIRESELFADLAAKIAKITVNETAISAETQARVAALLATNSGIASETTQRKSADEEINTALSTNVSKTNANTAAISTETNTRTTQLNAQSNRIDIVAAKSNANAGLIVEERNARTTALSAQADRLVAVEAKASNAQSRVGTLEITTASNTQAIATTKTELRAEFVNSGKVKDTRDDNEPPQWYYDNYPQRIATEFKKSSVIGVTGSTYAYLETTVRWRDPSGGQISQIAYTDDGKIYLRYSTNTTAWDPWVQQENTVGSQAKVNAAKTALQALITANTAAINEERTARTTAVGAVARSVSTLQTTVNGNTASIQTSAESIDGIKLKWSLRVDSNGVVGGIGLIGNGSTIDFLIRASNFAIAGVSGSKEVPFIVQTTNKTVNGVVAGPGVYIEDSFTRNGSIGNAKIGHAAVDTLQLRGQAVTITTAAYKDAWPFYQNRKILAYYPYQNGSEENDLLTATIDTDGAGIIIEIFLTRYRSRHTYEYGGATEFRVYRDNELIHTIKLMHEENYQQTASFKIMTSGKKGVATYKLVAHARNSAVLFADDCLAILTSLKR